MDYTKFDLLCSKLAAAYKKLDFDTEYVRKNKASPDSIAELENDLDIKLPCAVREFFADFSGEYRMNVSFSNEFCGGLPSELDMVFSAFFDFSIEMLRIAETNRRGWVEKCFNNPDDPYDMEWHGKLGFMTVGNGDIIAFDVSADADDPPVVYLSHDDGDGHGAVLGKSFEDFAFNLVRAGACGNEDWQLLAFMKDKKSGIDAECENAVKFRDIIGFDAE